jgi:hypothetical protein
VASRHGNDAPRFLAAARSMVANRLDPRWPIAVVIGRRHGGDPAT